MPLTPIDVQQKTFATALRGYDLDEVDDFLDSVVVALKDYDQRLADAQERISTLKAELKDSGDSEGAIARALVAAQRSADAIIADAKEQAERILEDAGSEASDLAETHEAERSRLEAEIEEIRSKVAAVRSSVAELTATIPVTLDEIDEVLDTSIDQPESATFDAAEPVGGYELSSDDEDSDGPDAEADVGAIEDVEEIDLSVSAPEPSGQHVDSSEHESFDMDEAAGDESDFDGDEQSDDDFSDVDTSDEASDDSPRELPSIEELSQRIDSAFDDLVAEADEVSEGSQRPWED